MPPLHAPLQIDDAGQYQCIAENEVGAVEKVVILVLQSESCSPPRLGPGWGRCEVGTWVWNTLLRLGWCVPGPLIGTEGREAEPGTGSSQTNI